MPASESSVCPCASTSSHRPRLVLSCPMLHATSSLRCFHPWIVGTLWGACCCSHLPCLAAPRVAGIPSPAHKPCGSLFTSYRNHFFKFLLMDITASLAVLCHLPVSSAVSDHLGSWFTFLFSEILCPLAHLAPARGSMYVWTGCALHNSDFALCVSMCVGGGVIRNCIMGQHWPVFSLSASLLISGLLKFNYLCLHAPSAPFPEPHPRVEL